MSVSTYMSAQATVLDLLRYVGVYGFTAPDNDQSLNQMSVDNDDVLKAVIAVNSALQTIQKYGPQDLKFGRGSAYFRPTSTLVVSVANGSSVGTATTTPPAASKGCSCMIDGDTDLNRITGIATNTLTFLRPFIGTGSAPANVTIYYDCVALTGDVGTVQEPVLGRSNLRLYPSPDLDDFERLRNRAWWWGGWRQGYGFGYATYETITTALGTPARYYVERQTDGTPFLRVSPMPVSDFSVTFQYKRRAERITDGSLYLDQTGATDPNYRFSSLVNDDLESAFLPIARWRFFTHPSLKNAETRASVYAEYREVMDALKLGAVFETSVKKVRAGYR